MKVFWISISIFMLAHSIVSQNLIPNPGFEYVSKCPESNQPIDQAYPWSGLPVGSGVIIHGCSDDPTIRPPTAPLPLHTFQYPRSGIGMGKFLVFRSVYPNVARYIQTPLTSRLKPDVKYYIRFFISVSLYSTNHPTYTDVIGLALTEKKTEHYPAFPEVIRYEPAIENRGRILKDTAGWTKISGCYTASGTESWAIIGNFRGIEGTLFEYGNQPVIPIQSHFYIDDILVTEFNPMPDTMILCRGEEITIDAGFYGASIRWNTGVEDSIITINKPGIYIVKAFLDDCWFSDTMVVVSEPNWQKLRQDTTICKGETITIKSPTWGNYNWSNNSSQSFIEVNEAGIYSLTVENKCGIYEYEIDVETADCGCEVVVPNIFTPNGDFINDLMTIGIECDYSYKVLDFRVFNRWGEEVYYQKGDNLVPWDGTFKNMPAAIGVYAWILRMEIKRKGKTQNQVFTGDITLLR